MALRKFSCFFAICLDGLVHRLLCFPHPYFLSDDTGSNGFIAL
jgi:hypothetical protein